MFVQLIKTRPFTIAHWELNTFFNRNLTNFLQEAKQDLKSIRNWHPLIFAWSLVNCTYTIVYIFNRNSIHFFAKIQTRLEKNLNWHPSTFAWCHEIFRILSYTFLTVIVYILLQEQKKTRKASWIDIHQHLQEAM